MIENKKQAEATKKQQGKAKPETKPKDMPKEKPKEVMINMNEFAEKIVQKAILEMRKDFSNLAYRVFATELSVYGLLNKGSIPKEFRLSVSRQEDLLNASVELMLKRLEEIRIKQEEEAETKAKEKAEARDREDKK